MQATYASSHTRNPDSAATPGIDTLSASPRLSGTSAAGGYCELPEWCLRLFAPTEIAPTGDWSERDILRRRRLASVLVAIVAAAAPVSLPLELREGVNLYFELFVIICAFAGLALNRANHATLGAMVAIIGLDIAIELYL